MTIRALGAALIAAGLLGGCASARPTAKVATSLTAIAADVAAKGQWETAAAILRNARELEPGNAAIAAKLEAVEAKRRGRGSVDLPYQFALDGFEVAVTAADFTTDVSAFDHTVTDRLASDERWLAVTLAVLETQGRERVFPWITMVRLRTALGQIVSAPHSLRSRADAGGAEQGRFHPNEREDMRIFFRVKRGDFPVQLVCADGAAIPLGD